MLSAFEQVRSPAVALAPADVPPALDLRFVPLEIARRHDASRSEAREQAFDDVERHVRDGDVRRWDRVGERICPERSHGGTVHGCVREGRLDRGVVEVDPDDRLEAEFRSGDGEDARAASDVEQAARLELLQQLECQVRGRVRTGAEGAAGVDHDRFHAGRRVFPRRPNPEAADDDTVMECPPGVLPALGDLLRGDLEAFSQPVLAQRVGIDGEAAVDLLDALWEEIEQLRELGLAAGDDDAPQRNALFSLPRKPSSLLYVFSSVCVSNSSNRRRCSSLK
jgi:hypothetical protein